MSENKCQSLLELDKSIQQSPNFQPYDAARKPAKPVLKTPPGGDSSKLNVTPLSKKKKQTVLYNTMINSKSKFAARAVASDFFQMSMKYDKYYVFQIVYFVSMFQINH